MDQRSSTPEQRGEPGRATAGLTPGGAGRSGQASGGAALTQPAPVRLTPREQQVLVLMVEGLSNKQIGRRLDISFHGAKRLVASILAKLDSPTRTVAVARALREGLYEQYLAEQ